ncbi:hypothetical protein RQN30_07945 [Arcanobacterium hippocoleae]
MEQLGISAIHPPAPEVLSATALFNAPIDIPAAIVRLRELWAIRADGEWQHVAPDTKTRISCQAIFTISPSREYRHCSVR